MARRAASISRAVMRARSVALSPYSPNATKLPRCALPPILPLNCLRYLVRFGCIMCDYLNSSLCGRRGFGGLGAGRRGSLRLRGLGLEPFRLGLIEHFALEYPHLDADDAVGGLSFRKAVVDVGTEGVQRHPPFTIGLSARDFRRVQAARDSHFDSERTGAHRVRDGALHGAAEHDALLELLRDALGHQLRVELRLADLGDVEAHVLHGHAEDLGDGRAELLD